MSITRDRPVQLRDRERSSERRDDERLVQLIDAALGRQLDNKLAPLAAQVASLKDSVDQLAALKLRVEQQDGLIAALQKDLAQTKADLAETKFAIGKQRFRDRENNIAVFPKQHLDKEKFAAASLRQLALPLGLDSIDGLTLELSTPGIKVLCCSSRALKARIMTHSNREKASDRYGLVLQDDLHPEELTDKLALKPVMQYLRGQNPPYKAMWRRSSVAWTTRAGVRKVMDPWRAKVATAAELTALVDDWNAEVPLEDAEQGSQRGQPGAEGGEWRQVASRRPRRGASQQPQQPSQPSQRHASSGPATRSQGLVPPPPAPPAPSTAARPAARAAPAAAAGPSTAGAAEDADNPFLEYARTHGQGN